MKIKLKNVLPNPFRDLEHYPINGQKIEALKKSITDTEFWDNIVCRKVENGKVEIAYGHHRLHTLRELYDGDHTISLIPKKLDDETMLKIMAHENLQEWGHVSDIERETVRAVVTAFGEDKISLNRPNPKTKPDKMRCAPGYCLGNSGQNPEYPYTSSTVANFLGWESDTVRFTLQALCLIEEENLTDDHLDTLSTTGARTVTTETRRAISQGEKVLKDVSRESKLPGVTPAKAKLMMKQAGELNRSLIVSTANAVSDTLKNGEGIAAAISNGRIARHKCWPKDKESADMEIDKVASRTAGALIRYLDPEKKTGMVLDEIIEYKDHLGTSALNDLAMALGNLIEYAEGYRHQLTK